MRRRDLIRHLEAHGCRLRREGRSHSVYGNPANGKSSTVPRHREVNLFTAWFCDDLSVPRLEIR